MRRVPITILFLILYMNSIVNSQVIQSLSTTVPMSPQAEAIKRFGEFTVNNFTGTPDISIPLYEINHRGYKIPLVLRYLPTPLKPGYNYDVFGHGWSLLSNSCISRTIEFIPDEERDFKLDLDKLGVSYWAGGVIRDPTKFNLAYDKFSTTLPDGTSFDFVIKNEYGRKEYIVSDGRRVKIIENVNNGKILSFIVIDENGVKYTFDGADTPLYTPMSSHTNSYVTWLLTRIDLPYSKEKITFTYSQYIQPSVARGFNEYGIYISSAFGSNSTVEVQKIDNYQYNTYKMRSLTAINYGNSKIVFSYKNESSAEKTVEHNFVTNIQIWDRNNLIKKILLDMQEYKVHSSVPDLLTQLHGIKIVGENGIDTSETYQFKYSSSSFFFAGTDHWGYLNYSANGVAHFNFYVDFDPIYHMINTKIVSIIPTSSDETSPFFKLKLSPSPYATQSLRSPSSPESHGVLTQLTYPTGGYAKFEFENHKYLSSTDYDGNYNYDPKKRRSVQAAGFRIKTITNCTKDGTVVDVKNYRYGKTYSEDKHETYDFEGQSNFSPNAHTGVGEPVVEPSILTYMEYSYQPYVHPIRNMILGLNNQGKREFFLNPFTATTAQPANFVARDGVNSIAWAWDCLFSAINFRKVLNGRPSVVYPNITVYYGDPDEDNRFNPLNTIGKTIYQYDVMNKTQKGDEFFEASSFLSDVLTYTPQKYKYNILIQKDDYRPKTSSFEKIKEEEYSWNYKIQTISDYASKRTFPYIIKPGPMTTISQMLSGKLNLIGDAKIQSLFVSETGDSKSSRFTEDYAYNERRQLKEKTYNRYVEPNWRRYESTIDTFGYPGDNKTDTSEAIIKMVDENIISPVIRQTRKKRSYPIATEEETEAFVMDYKEFDTGDSFIIMPEVLYQLEKQNSKVEYILKNKILRYSTNGNPLEVVGQDNLHTVYLWSYDDRYLVAELKGLTYAEAEIAVKTTFGVADIGALSKLTFTNSDQTSLLGKFKTLREHSSLKNALVTTYTYKPLVGMTTATDPSGKTTIYEYDSLNRLYRIKDHNGKIIEEYKYNYKNR